MANCKNCEHPLKEDDKFCSSCGQKSIERLRLRTLLGELASTFFAWDSKLFATLKLLLFTPGQVSLNYIAGKRKRYVAPLRIYLFFSVVFFLAISLLGSNVSAPEGEGPTDVNFSLGDDTSFFSRDTLILMEEHNRLDELPIIYERENDLAKTFVKQVIRVSIQHGDFPSFLRENASIMFFFFIPVFGWILKLFHRKNELDYIEHLVFGLYFHSFLFFILLVTLLVSHLIGVGWPLLVGILVLLVYFTGGLKRFYGAKLGKTIRKSIFIILVYLILFVIFAVITVGITIWFY